MSHSIKTGYVNNPLIFNPYSIDTKYVLNGKKRIIIFLWIDHGLLTRLLLIKWSFLPECKQTK